jgi:hypothetical protein
VRSKNFLSRTVEAHGVVPALNDWLAQFGLSWFIEHRLQRFVLRVDEAEGVAAEAVHVSPECRGRSSRWFPRLWLEGRWPSRSRRRSI